MPSNNPNSFLKYTSIALQMIVIIVAGTFGGRWLDKYLQNHFPWFTLIGVLLSVFVALYTTIKEFLKK